jgi:hypothetical protein
MAVTATVATRDEVKGPYQGNPTSQPYHLWRVPISIAGTYATGGFQVDLCAAITGARMAVGALTVNWAKSFGDYFDGTTAATVADAQTALASGGASTPISSSSTNNLATLKLYTGTNGTGGAELANATPLAGTLGVLVAVTYTIGTLGNL